MPRNSHLQDVLGFTTVAASTARHISISTNVPFLGGASLLVIAIVNMIKSLRSSKEQFTQTMEHIHEILTAIILLYDSTQIGGVLPPNILSAIADFTESLRKMHVYVKRRTQGIGKLKRILNLSENEMQYKACRAQIERTLDTFRLQLRMSAVSSMFQMQMDMEQKHKELMEFLAAHPNITRSDCTSEISGPLSGTTGSSPSISLLPPPPQIFHGRDSELQEVVYLLHNESPRIVILGPGGMGKTSLAQAALHHEEVVAKYSERYFVPCHSSLTSAELISTVASHIGFEGGKRSREIVQYFSSNSPSLLVLDNFETTWEHTSTRTEVEDFLSILTDVPHLALLVTMRGAERPEKIKWTRPFPRPLIPLSRAAAHDVFVDIAEDKHDEGKVQQLLDLTDNLPLAVSLMASVVGYEGCDRTLARWAEENTHLLSDGCDQRSSLDISIMLSYSSPRMTPGAQELLALLSMLPDGLSDADLIQSRLPIENILACKSTLIQVSLAYVDNTQHLKSLVPVREYIQRVHPPSRNLKDSLGRHLQAILCIGDNPWAPPENLARVKSMAGNLHNIISDAMSDDSQAHWEATLESVIQFSRCMRFAGVGGSSLMVELWPKMMQHPGTPNYGTYFSELLRLINIISLPIDIEACIKLGSRHFSGEHPSESHCQWYYSLGFFYQRRNRLGEALHCFETALLLAEDEISIMHSAILVMTGRQLNLMGVPSRGLAYAQKAKHIGELVGDMHTMTMSMLAEAWSQQGLGNLLCAEKLCREAREQLPLIAKDTEDHLPEILLTKTEYQEARALLFKTLEYRSSCKPPISDTVVCHINLALIAIEIGAGVEVIKHHIDAVRTQCTTFVVWATGILWADTLTAPVHLLEGNISLARETFQKCLLSSQNTKVAEISAFCLSKLADLQHAMYGHWDTMRWAVVYLAFGMTTTNKVSITRALRCIGDLLVVEGDHETSLNVFSTALDAFTFMDIHRDRADCMVCTAEIFEIRGEIEKSVDLWRKARPLYEKSSQAQEILKIDEKLAILAHEMKQQHWRG